MDPLPNPAPLPQPPPLTPPPTPYHRPQHPTAQVDHTGAELELLETVAGRKQLVHEEVLAVGKPVLVVGILSSSSGSDDALGFSKGYGQGVCHGRRGRPAWLSRVLLSFLPSRPVLLARPLP